MNTRQQILKSAEQLFASQGYERTTIDQIAAQLHLSKGAVYYFFSGKPELFCCVADTGLAELEQLIRELIRAERSGGCIAQDLIRAYVDISYDCTPIVLMLMGGLRYGTDAAGQEIQRPRALRLLEITAQAVQLGMDEHLLPAGDCHLTARIFLGALYGIAVLPDPPPREQAVASICALLTTLPEGGSL